MGFGKDTVLVEALPIIVLSGRQLLIMHSVTYPHNIEEQL
jgi:hypothetical protein